MTLEEMTEAGYKSHAGEMGYNDVTRHKLYFDGFKDGFDVGMNTVLNRLKEMRLKEVERSMDKVLNALVSWKPD